MRDFRLKERTSRTLKNLNDRTGNAELGRRKLRNLCSFDDRRTPKGKHHANEEPGEEPSVAWCDTRNTHEFDRACPSGSAFDQPTTPSYHDIVFANQFDHNIPGQGHAACLHRLSAEDATLNETLCMSTIPSRLWTNLEPSSVPIRDGRTGYQGPPHSAARCPYDSHQALVCGEGSSADPENGLEVTFARHDVPACQRSTDLIRASRPTYDLSSPPANHPAEHSAMHYFNTVVAEDVSDVVASNFWKRSVRQVCQTEDAARQAAVALSQAYMEISLDVPRPRHPCAIRKRL